MNSSSLPRAPVSAQEFYVLLALGCEEGYAYGLLGQTYNLSQGCMQMASGTLHALLMRFGEEGYIEETGFKPAGKSGSPRMHYRLSELGVIRLKEELARLGHALKVAEYHGLLVDEMPLDIQKLILKAH